MGIKSEIFSSSFFILLLARAHSVSRSDRESGDVLLFLAPLVLLPDLLLLGGREVVLDVERLADLLGGLALDHVGHGLASDVEEALDVQVVGGQDQLKEGALVDLKKKKGSDTPICSVIT